ncbi:hypothetical protein MRB53_037527 [Persea americana]|nr:hypothetical protein MRB53_037527 [Persea americana]
MTIYARSPRCSPRDNDEEGEVSKRGACDRVERQELYARRANTRNINDINDLHLHHQSSCCVNIIQRSGPESQPCDSPAMRWAMRHGVLTRATRPSYVAPGTKQ